MAMAASEINRHSLSGKSPHEILPLEERKCPFCGKGHREGLEFSKGFIDILTGNRVWASDEATFRSNYKSFWAHSVCVHFSPQTFYDESHGGSWQFVSREYHRARCLTCTVCGEKGASIGCHVSTCHVSCHFPCATQERLADGRKNWFPIQEPSIPYFCMNHGEERAEHERSKEIARLADLSQGRETYPIPLEMGLAEVGRDSMPARMMSGRGAYGNGGGGVGGGGGSRGSHIEIRSSMIKGQWDRLLPEAPLPKGILTTRRDIDFVYVTSAVGSKSVQVEQGPEKEKRCCFCTGPNACRDPRVCQCLRDGRNYRWKGRRLDEGHPEQVYECNLNCSCHPTACRNRLVQKGMTCKIDVAYLGPSRRLLEGCDKKWGVRAAEDISVGSFVCTVAGQLVLRSEADGMDGEDRNSTVLVHRFRPTTADQHKDANHLISFLSSPSSSLPTVSQRSGEIVLDQRKYANISRYIRCARREEDANLLRVAVHTTYQDDRVPVLALFAGTNIVKGTELVRGR